MDESHRETSRGIPGPAPAAKASDERRPAFEVIPLDCEITAYAPDGGDPLF